MGAVAVGVAIGAVVGGAAAAIQSGGDFNAIWKGALVGAVGGAVGGWAAPALAPALGTVGAGMAAGALGGVTSGVLGTALSGGNSSDYLKNGLFGGLGGAAVGGVTAGLGEAFGGQAGVNGELAAPVSEPTTTPLDMSSATSIEGPTVPITEASGPTGLATGGNTSDVINASVTGAPAQTAPAYTAPQIDAGTQPLQFASNQTMTDVPVQSSAIPQELPGGYQAPTNTVPPLSQSAFGTGDTFTTGTPDFAGTDITSTPMGATEYAPFGGDTGSAPVAASADKTGGAYWEKYLPGGAPENPSAWDNFKGWMSQTTAGRPTVNTDGGFLGTAKTLGKGLMIGQALKGAGALLGQNEARQNQGQLMDLYNQQNAYMQQQQGQNAQAFQQNLAANTANQQAFRDQLAAAQGYNTQLQGTYEDPNAYLNSPEAQATRSLAMQKLLAQNAMAGRRSSGLALQNQLMANQLQNIGAYRQGLRSAIQYPNQLAGMQYQNVDAATNARILANAQAQSPTGNLMAGLGSMFAPAATYYLMG